MDSADGNTAEKDAPPNQTLHGFEVIDAVKETLEEQCLGVVSCADILALAARDVVFMVNGPYYGVPQGRRDGTPSDATDTIASPAPSLSASVLIQPFDSHGLTVQDMVALFGGHTLGITHCANFKDRLEETEMLDELSFDED